MATMQKISEYFKLTWAVEDIYVFTRRSHQIDFVANGAGHMPVVATTSIGWAVLDDGAASIR